MLWQPRRLSISLPSEPSNILCCILNKADEKEPRERAEEGSCLVAAAMKEISKPELISSNAWVFCRRFCSETQPKRVLRMAASMPRVTVLDRFMAGRFAKSSSEWNHKKNVLQRS